MTGRWSVVVPYYNEADGYLEATLRSLLAQSVRPLTLILVDNDSTDASAAIARTVTVDAPDVVTLHLQEARAGKIYALEAGLAAVDTAFVAVCDADTVYPPHYLANAERLFDRHGARAVAVLAMSVGPEPARWQAWAKRWKGVVMSRLLPGQAHTGGYAHSFRTQALRAAGGFSKALWPYLLEDHEVIHRVLKQGRTLYDVDQWCQSSDRRADRSGVRWTLGERLLYHFTPFAAKDWFFYRFLARRFEKRQMSDIKLRQREWDTSPPDHHG